LSLRLELFADVFIHVFALFLTFAHVGVQVFVERHLQLIVVINRLSNVVNCLSVPDFKSVIFPNQSSCVPNLSLHKLLARPIVIDGKTKPRIELIKLLELVIEAVCLLLKLQDLVLLRSDITFEILNLVIQDKFEFFKFLRFLLQFKDFLFAVLDVIVLFVDCNLLSFDLFPQLVAILLLLCVLSVFVLDLSL